MFVPFLPQSPRREPTDPATAAFRFWISFWPVAPFFGVRWRFEDLMVPVHGNLAARPAGLARAGAEVQERVVEEAAAAPAIARPAAEQAAQAAQQSTDRIEEAIEATMEPEAPAAEHDGANGKAHVRKPKGLKTKAPANPDDLKLIKGIGPSLERQLNGLGIYSFRQIADLDEQDLAWVDQHLETGTFKGRCYRDDWVGQAKAQLG